MDVYRVSFFGHRMLYRIRDIEQQVEDLARELMRKKDYVEFYVGRNGDFDVLVASAVKRAQAAEGRQNSALILVLPYPVKDLEYYERFYDEIVLPIDSKTHFKIAITKRNEWMVEHSDLVAVCVQKQEGGAYRALEYAQKMGVETVHFGNEKGEREV